MRRTKLFAENINVSPKTEDFNWEYEIDLSTNEFVIGNHLPGSAEAWAGKLNPNKQPVYLFYPVFGFKQVCRLLFVTKDHETLNTSGPYQPELIKEKLHMPSKPSYPAGLLDSRSDYGLSIRVYMQ